MATDTLEVAGDLRVLAVRASGTERWRPGHPDRLEAGHEVLVAGSRARWEEVRALAGAGRSRDDRRSG
jgi:hypothetical protein